jgi:deoxyadenosine/deoxycytidine kinase
MNNPPDQPDSQNQPLIGVVGVCASGKSSLIQGLETQGFRTRHIAQEHSFVKDMWKRITNPDVLIFLDVTYPLSVQRRQLNWTEADWAEQQRRLAHAREHADLYIQTDDLSIEQVLEIVIAFVGKLQNR